MIIYLDVIFIENLFIDFIILYTTGKVLKIEVKFLKILIASIIASVYTMITIIFPIKFLYTIIMKMVVSSILIYVAYKVRNRRDVVKYTITFYFISIIFGGVVYSEIGLLRNKAIFYISIFLISKAIITIFNLISRKININRLKCNIFATFQDIQFNIEAYIDTGHFLKCDMTNEDVIIAYKGSVPQELSSILNDENVVHEKYQEKIRIVTYNTFDKLNSNMAGIKLDKIIITYNQLNIENENVVLCITDNKFSGYDALIGMNLINIGGNENGNYIAIKSETEKILL